MCPGPEQTRDGFEATFGTNHLGHFAYAGQVLPSLLAAPQARVVTVSSLSHRFGDTQWEAQEQGKDYRMSRTYARSKLANLLFAFELQRRLASVGSSALSVGVHPGFAQTAILGSDEPTSFERWSKRLTAGLVPSAADAARPSLRAATSPDVRGGEYYGPRGPGGIGGAPVAVKPSPKALREQDAGRLWELSTRLTGVTPDLG